MSSSKLYLMTHIIITIYNKDGSSRESFLNERIYDYGKTDLIKSPV